MVAMEFIQTLDVFVPLFTAILTFFAVLTGLGYLFNLLLRPLKENQDQLKKNQDQLKKNQDQLKRELTENISRLESKIDNLLKK